jgi:hypothetical protein
VPPWSKTSDVVEAHKMGGDCLVWLRAVKGLDLAPSWRNRCGTNYESEQRHTRVQHRYICGSSGFVPLPHDSVERYTPTWASKCFRATPHRQPWTVVLNDRWRHANADHRSIVIAAGACISLPPRGLDDVGYVTSDTLWDVL